MKCPSCQSENRSGAHFCGTCGARLSRGCSRCGTENPPENVFCDKCGSDLREFTEVSAIDFSQPRSYTPTSLAEKILTTRSSIEGERKVVTVLFADVADYTSISERLDPEQVHRIMGGCFRILLDEVHRYEGTIDKFTGDGVMALFGVPLAHEDHAQRACHAALSIQKALATYGQRLRDSLGFKFQMRMGLNSGTVVVGSVGDDLRMDYTALGDTTNLAARMQDLAQPGKILVADHTQRLARDFFEFHPLGKLPVKGKAAPQEAYELVRASRVETRFQAEVVRGLTPFVGRRDELEALKDAFARARSGAGQVIGITGDAGVGKSRLLREFRNALPEGEHRYLEGRCLHYGEATPYLPILDMLKSYFQIQEGDSEEKIKGKVRERLGRLDGALLKSLAPLEDVLSLKVEDPVYLQIEPQHRRQRIFEFLRDLPYRVSRDRPLVLAIEDLHWIDRTTLDFLDFFAGGLSQVPILLVLLYRPEYRHTQASKAYCREIPLDQLSEGRTGELVRSLLVGGEVAPEISDLVLSRAGGNPLFVEELIRSLLLSSAIRRTDHRYELIQKISSAEVPDTIQGIIAGRMDRLGEPSKRILQAASVMGTEFACNILGSVTGMTEELKPCLVNLQEVAFIYEKQASPEPEYRFKHALTQEVAYHSLLTHVRRKTHEKVGKAIEELYPERLEEYYELLSYHYVRSDDAPKAVEYLDLANQKAVKAHAMEDAMAYFDKAMELLDTLPETEGNKERRISLVANQHLVFFYLMKFTEYQEILARYEPMAAGIRDRGLQGGFYARTAWWEFLFGHFDQAIETGTRALELCEAAAHTEGIGVAYLALTHSLAFRGDYERVLALKERALRMMEGGFLLRNFARVILNASWACTELGRWHEADELGQKALEAARSFGDSSLITWSAWTISIAHVRKRDLKRAIEYAELSMATAHTPTEKVMAQAILAWAWCHTGESKKGLEILVGLVELAQAVGTGSSLLWHTHYLAEGYWLAGQFEKALQTAEDLLKVSERCNARGYVGMAHRLLGEVTLKTDPHRAGPHFDRAISIFRETKAENELALAYAGRGRLHRLQGNTLKAREYLTQALEIFERLGTLIEPDKVSKELGTLP